MDYAIIQTGGKQYKVQPGDILEVEKLPHSEGSQVELDQVFVVSQEGQVTIGNPLVEGARVVAEIANNGRGKKLIVFKYKRKTRYRIKQGHRQSYTRLTIKEILVGGTKPRVRRRTRQPKEREA